MKSGSIHDDATFDGLLAWLPVMFVGLIALGLAALRLPVGMLLPGQTLRPIDAVFTVASAVCCAGFPLRDPAATFSPLGLTVLGLLVQVGAMTYMVAGAAVACRVRARLEPDQHYANGPTLGQLIRGVVGFTLAVELAAVLLMLPLAPAPADEAQAATMPGALTWSLFHTVSAFCNAGFTLQENSLRNYRLTFLTHGLIAPLIVLGGLGYPVLREMAGQIAALGRRIAGGPGRTARGMGLRPARGLSTYSRLALTTTAIIYLVGLVGILAGQIKPYSNEFFKQGFDSGQKRPGALTSAKFSAVTADASFMSLSARTTAFYTIPLDDRTGDPQFLQPAGQFLLMPLMAVGGTVGGAAGGIGTITLAILVMAGVRAARKQVPIHPPPDSPAAAPMAAPAGANAPTSFSLITWAGTVLLAYLGLVVLAGFLLSLSEPYQTRRLLFDAVSAASGAGLALDPLRDMTAFGQCVLIGTVLAARIGGPMLMGRMLMGPIVPSSGFRVPG
jgi:trk system potassium uptake protein